MRGARAMGFNTTFRTTHGRCRFRGVQFLPVTQQERFALTRRELAQRFFNHRDQLGLSQSLFRTGWLTIVVFILQGVERVENFAFMLRRE